MPYVKSHFAGSAQATMTKLQSTEAKLEKAFNPPVSGTVYGTLLNYQGSLAKMGDALNEDPYKAPPKAPILYIKPINTLLGHKGEIPMPSDAEELVIGASIGLVIGKKATKVRAEEALDYVEGYTVVNDVSLPHESVFRPAVKEKARNGFCPIGPWVVEKEAVNDIDDVNIKVYINGELKQQNNTKNLVRTVPVLLQDVTEFMTLSEGDVLMIGVPEDPPIASRNDTVRIEVEGIGVLENTIK